MPHGVQCWRVRGACCPSLAKQLVIWVVVVGTHRHRNLLLQLDVHWNVPGWYECCPEKKPCKRVRARGGGAWACFAHGLQCLCDGRACCPSLPKQLVICRFLRCSPAPSRCCFKSLSMWTGTGCIEFPTEWNLYKRARARSGAS